MANVLRLLCDGHICHFLVNSAISTFVVCYSRHLGLFFALITILLPLIFKTVFGILLIAVAFIVFVGCATVFVHIRRINGKKGGAICLWLCFLFFTYVGMWFIDFGGCDWGLCGDPGRSQFWGGFFIFCV